MKRPRRRKKSANTGSSDSAAVTCPYCFEELELFVDPDVEGSYVQDCEVCCNPWQITVTRDEEGRVVADVGRAN
jgi:hypothetical protein